MPYSANSSVYHRVPVVIQRLTWACWYTAFSMVVTYKRGQNAGGALKDPAEVPWVQAIYDANQGIGATPDEREKVARALGFTPLLASLSADGIWDVLSAVPVIYAGRWPGQAFGHWVVLTGISETRLLINNPATGMESHDYNWFVGQVLLQSEERPLIHPPF